MCMCGCMYCVIAVTLFCTLCHTHIYTYVHAYNLQSHVLLHTTKSSSPTPHKFLFCFQFTVHFSITREHVLHIIISIDFLYSVVSSTDSYIYLDFISAGACYYSMKFVIPIIRSCVGWESAKKCFSRFYLRWIILWRTNTHLSLLLYFFLLVISNL